MHRPEIPNRITRATLVETFCALTRIYREGLIKSGIDPDLVWILSYIYDASFHNQGISASKLSILCDTPRETVRRKLSILIKADFVAKEGNYYRIPPRRLFHPPAEIDKAARIMLRAADIIKRTQ